MSIAGKRKSVQGPGLDGKPKRGFLVKVGSPNALAVHHDPNVARLGDKPDASAHRHGHRGHSTGTVHDGRTVRAGGALDIHPRSGRAKMLTPVSIHGGMNTRQIAGASVGGLSHATAAVVGGTVTTDQAAAPLQHAYGVLPKAQHDVKATFGQRSRTRDHARSKELGRAILDTATRN